MSKLEQLRKEVDSLMRISDEYGINIDGFWEQFEKTYGYKPEPREFGRSRLISLLDLFPNLIKVRKRHTKRSHCFATYVCLKKTTNDKGDRGQGASDTSRKSSHGIPKEELKVAKRKEDLGHRSGSASLASSSNRKETPNNRKQNQAKQDVQLGSSGKTQKSNVSDITSKESNKKKDSVAKQNKGKHCDKSASNVKSSSSIASREDKKKKSEIIKISEKGRKIEGTMSKDPKSLNEMEGQGYIFHTYGRERSSSGERNQQSRGGSSQSQSRLPLWMGGADGGRNRDQTSQGTNPVFGHNLTGQTVPSDFFSAGAYGMMPTTVPMPTMSSCVSGMGAPLVYGMNFPSLSDVSSMLSQAQGSSGKSAKQLQKQQEQTSTQDAFILLNSDEEKSKIAPPPPRQYKEPPSATAIAAAATSKPQERESPSTSRSRHTPQSSGSRGKNTTYVSKQELESVAADCIDRQVHINISLTLKISSWENCQAATRVRKFILTVNFILS